MKFYNCHTVCSTLGLPKGSHRKLVRYLYQLVNPKSPVYNPAGASALKKVLESVTFNFGSFKSNRDDNTMLFLNNVEAMLSQTYSWLKPKVDIDSTGTLTEMLFNDVLEDKGSLVDWVVLACEGNTIMPKYKFHAVIDALLYSHPIAECSFVDEFQVNICCDSLYAEIAIIASVVQYLNKTPDEAKRDNAYRNMTKKREEVMAHTNRDSMAMITLIDRLIATFRDYRYNVSELPTGESFTLFFKLLTLHVEDKQIVHKCIAARNAAAHGTKQHCDNSVLSVYIQLLISSFDLLGYDKEYDDKWKIRRTMFFESLPNNIISIIVGIPGLAIWAYFILMIVSLFLGRTDMEKVNFFNMDTELNMRFNEAVGMKDTTTVLEIHRNVKWIQDLHDRMTENEETTY